MSDLRNKLSKEELKTRIEQDNTPRQTVSFYKYVKISDPKSLRDELFQKWTQFGALGRIYLAQEGINAQMSVPQSNWEAFEKDLYTYQEFSATPFKFAVENNPKSFYKLTIKVKEKIVADGIDDKDFDPSNSGKHLSAEEFNQLLEKPESIVVDVRNHYESEVGHFEKAIRPDADTFREELPLIENMLKNDKEKPVLLYCTGGIRCEKASAYLKHKGFKEVYQLNGGIIQYAHEAKSKNLPIKFRGKNFVFDERVGERITEDIISECHQCGCKSDEHVNCKNDDCHLLFIQCKTCQQKFDGCCTKKCQEISKLPIEEQKKLRKGKNKDNCLAVYKSRLRPKLKPELST